MLIEVQGTRLVPMSGRELVDATARVRGYLRANGVVSGDRVGLLGPNSSRWAAIDVAIMAEGAICVPLYARQAPAQLAGMLRDAGPKLLLVADDKLEAAMKQAWPDACPIVHFQAALAHPPIEADERASRAGIDDQCVTIVYTSGTSGEPKGAMLGAAGVNFMLDVTVKRIKEMSIGARAEDRVFHYLPFCFAGSRIMLWSQLRRGNPMWLSTDLDKLQDELQAAKPHYFMNVPVLLERVRNGVEKRMTTVSKPLRALYERGVTAYRSQLAGTLQMRERMWLMSAQKLIFPRIKHLIGENLEFLVCGSARLSEDTQRWFEMLGIPVFQVYGLTESTGIITIDDTKNVRPGRVGHVIPGCEIRVTEDGELACRGPNVFLGYWKRPEATAQMIRDGWLYTGDQCEIDATGSVRIAGRLKDVIVPESGHNVAPAPIEERLVQAGVGIEQALVVGHGRPYLTAIVTGAVDDAQLTAAREQVNATLPHYQRLRKLFRAQEPFSADNGLLTANQKLKRGAIEAHYASAIEEMYR
jgi:long-chain acyl-CoA synthetase